MNKKTLGVLAACVGIALSGLPSLASADNDRGRGHGRHEWRDHGGWKEHQRREWRDDRRNQRQGYVRGYGQGYDRGYDRAMADQRRWARGDRLPRGYSRHYHVVHDWRGHRLHRPHPGHQWVQVGTEMMLVAIATGVITQIILNR